MDNKDIVKKKEINHILDEKRNWKDVNEELPSSDDPVVIRFWNPDIVCWENKESVYHLEDVMVARWKDGEWNIEPPFHKYSYSPLTTIDSFKPGTVVTHWAVPEENEVNDWHNRLAYFHEYHHLKLDVDPENEEKIYQALLKAASLIETAFNQSKNEKIENDLSETFERIKDLQYAIDGTTHTLNEKR